MKSEIHGKHRQFKFMKRRDTAGVTFIIDQIQEKNLGGKTER